MSERKKAAAEYAVKYFSNLKMRQMLEEAFEAGWLGGLDEGERAQCSKCFNRGYEEGKQETAEARQGVAEKAEAIANKLDERYELPTEVKGWLVADIIDYFDEVPAQSSDDYSPSESTSQVVGGKDGDN